MSKVGQKSLEEVCTDCLYNNTIKEKEVCKVANTVLLSNGQVSFEEVLNKMLTTYIEKNNDYGNSFEKLFEEFGMTSSLIRLSDKLERLKSLQNKEQKVGDESQLDTLLDMANYAIMTYVILNNR